MSQGSSSVATPAKQSGLIGMIDMLTKMRQKSYKPVVILDFYCGSGHNVLDGQTINGSPLSIIEGVCKAINAMKELPKQPMFIVFNDIVSMRVNDLLPEKIEEWQEKNGLPVDRNQLVCFNNKNERFAINLHYSAGDAADLCDSLLKAVRQGYHCVSIIDPNGPKHVPWEKLRSIYNSHQKSLELIFHISATTLKRVWRARESTDIQFSPMPDHIADMLTYFNDCGGWIRQPAGADQWTMMLISRFPPRNGWLVKDGLSFYKIEEQEGQKLIKHLSMTKAKRNERD